MAFLSPTPLQDICLTWGLKWKKGSAGFQQDTIPAYHNYVPSSSDGGWTGPGQPTSATVDMLSRLQENSQDDEEDLAQNK